MAESICGLKVFVGRFFPYQHIRGREKQKKLSLNSTLPHKKAGNKCSG